MDDEDNFMCGDCGSIITAYECGVLGACPGNLFCPCCETEIDASSGKPRLLCGKCEACESLMVDGDWASTQVKRQLNGAN